MLRTVRAVRLVLVLVATVPPFLVATAPAALAHAGPGGVSRPAEDFVSTITAFDPGLDGITVTTPAGSGLLTLTNTSAATVTIRGYDGEPYRRVGPDGIYENTRSPATYLNADLTGAAPVPDGASADAPPDWRRIGDGPTVTWHDHRTHWMLPYDPPEAQADPGTEHVIDPAWRVPVVVETAGAGGSSRTVDIVGELRWVPPATPWPWLGLAATLVVLLAAGAAGRRWRGVLTAGAVLVVGAGIADLLGMVGVSPGEPTLLGVLLPLGGSAGVVLGVALLRRRPDTAVVVLGVAGLALGLLVGFTTRTFLTHAQVPSGLGAPTARLVVAVALGAGIGLAAGALVRQQVAFREATAERR